MLTIAFLGSAGAGKSRALCALQMKVGGELAGDGPLLELRADVPQHGAVTALAVHGPVLEEGPLVRIVGRADAIVFVVDSRPSRHDQTVEMWEKLPRLLESAGHAQNLPVVIFYGHRDHEDALSIAVLDEALGIHAMFENPTLRMPNPVAQRFPARFEDVHAAFAAAVGAAVDGPFPIAPESVDFAMAMLDKQLAAQLAKVAPGLDEAVLKRALRGDEGSRAQMEQAMRDNVMAHLHERLETDPAFQAMIVGKLEDKFATMVMLSNLACAGCRNDKLHVDLAGTSGGPFNVGDAIAVDLDAVTPSYELVRRPARGESIVWLTGDRCDRCHTPFWCTLTITGGVIASSWPTTVTRDTFAGAHVVSSDARAHLAAQATM